MDLDSLTKDKLKKMAKSQTDQYVMEKNVTLWMGLIIILLGYLTIYMSMYLYLQNIFVPSVVLFATGITVFGMFVYYAYKEIKRINEMDDDVKEYHKYRKQKLEDDGLMTMDAIKEKLGIDHRWKIGFNLTQIFISLMAIFFLLYILAYPKFVQLVSNPLQFVCIILVLVAFVTYYLFEGVFNYKENTKKEGE